MVIYDKNTGMGAAIRFLYAKGRFRWVKYSRCALCQVFLSVA
jgi:hypothetical protein